MSNKRNPIIGFRVSEEEKERVNALATALVKRYPYLTFSDVCRELMGLTSTGLISDEMRLGLLPPEDVDDVQDVVVPPQGTGS